MKKKQNGQKKTRRINYDLSDLRVSFFSLIISIFSLFVSFFALSIDQEANDIERAQMIPSFSIEAITDGQKQTGYKIKNTGGNIQNIGVTITGILHFCATPFGDDFYIPYDIYASDYQTQENNEFSVNFSDSTYYIYDARLGMNNWYLPETDIDKLTSAHEEICEVLKEQGIWVNVDYMELLELSYIDAFGTARLDSYFIGTNEDSTFNLVYVPNPEQHIVLSNLERELYHKYVYDNSSTSTRVHTGYALRPSGNATTIYRESIIDLIVNTTNQHKYNPTEATNPTPEDTP